MVPLFNQEHTLLGTGNVHGFFKELSGFIIMSLVKKCFSQPELKPRAKMPITLIHDQSESFIKETFCQIKIFPPPSHQRQSSPIARLTFETAQFFCKG